MGGCAPLPSPVRNRAANHSTGGSLTSVVSSFENLDKKGHGVKLEAMSMMVRHSTHTPFHADRD